MVTVDTANMPDMQAVQQPSLSATDHLDSDLQDSMGRFRRYLVLLQMFCLKAEAAHCSSACTPAASPTCMQAYADLFTLPEALLSSSSQGSAHTSSHATSSVAAAAARSGQGAAAAAGQGSSDPALSLLLQRLPSTFADKFDGHVVVPIELWLQAFREAKVGAWWGRVSLQGARWLTAAGFVQG